MKSAQSSNKLQDQLTQMITIETNIEQRLGELIQEVSTHDEVTRLLWGFKALSGSQRQALETRLQAISDAVPLPKGGLKGASGGLPVEGMSSAGGYPVSTALQIVYTLLNQAVIGYSMLHSISTRFLDSVVIAEEGTSYHLARQHTQNYVQAIQQIAALLHDVVLWELDQNRLECQCTCPSCGVGICLCALAGRTFLRDTWLEAGPIPKDEGVYVQLPKQNSAATKAGLRRGDVILAAGGQEVGSYMDLQGVVKNAKSGEEILLTVRRGSDEPGKIVMVRP